MMFNNPGLSSTFTLIGVGLSKLRFIYIRYARNYWFQLYARNYWFQLMKRQSDYKKRLAISSRRRKVKVVSLICPIYQIWLYFLKSFSNYLLLSTIFNKLQRNVSHFYSIIKNYKAIYIMQKTISAYYAPINKLPRQPVKYFSLWKT